MDRIPGIQVYELADQIRLTSEVNVQERERRRRSGPVAIAS